MCRKKDDGLEIDESKLTKKQLEESGLHFNKKLLIFCIILLIVIVVLAIVIAKLR